MLRARRQNPCLARLDTLCAEKLFYAEAIEAFYGEQKVAWGSFPLPHDPKGSLPEREVDPGAVGP